jgi:phosphoglycolate phosphatase
MKPIDLLIFDLDGTLVNTIEDIAASVNHTLVSVGYASISLDTVRRYVGDGVEMLMTRALAGRAGRIDEAVSIYKNHHRRNLVVRSALYPTVRETLEHFTSLPMAVISNKTMEFVGPLLDRLDLSRYFKQVIGADSGLPLKPAPDAVQTLMTRFKAPKERTLIVGDGTTDVQAGKAAGIITCSVTYGFRSEEELRRAGPDFMIREMSELMALFVPEPST